VSSLCSYRPRMYLKHLANAHLLSSSWSCRYVFKKLGSCEQYCTINLCIQLADWRGWQAGRHHSRGSRRVFGHSRRGWQLAPAGGVLAGAGGLARPGARPAMCVTSC
jgi:hypothetical protein